MSTKANINPNHTILHLDCGIKKSKKKKDKQKDKQQDNLDL
jgi:hypothetical protein